MKALLIATLSLLFLSACATTDGSSSGGNPPSLYQTSQSNMAGNTAATMMRPITPFL